MTSTEFRAIRDQLGLSQAELGRLMGLTAREISRIEIARNPTRVQAAFIKHIAAGRGLAKKNIGMRINFGRGRLPKKEQSK